MKTLMLRILLILIRIVLLRLHKRFLRRLKAKIYHQIESRTSRIFLKCNIQSPISNAEMYLMKYLLQDMAWYRALFSSIKHHGSFVLLKTIPYG